ncbi:DNA-3-methyladenine glycosylase family protein [Paracoccus pacificus]|uniref:DNA-3-methyladenine glycosylase II n=1 Tax=Paracoccus pacificus TaxID=1463598 RepID=A0ABW4R6Z9_9RHOB
MRIISGPEDLAEGARWLMERDPVWARVLPTLGPLPLRRRDDGFGALLETIVGQQISTHAAGAILGRMTAAGLTAPDAIIAADDALLRAAGLSAAKIRYLRGIAAAPVDWQGLRDLSDDAVIAALVALPGVGQWTAEIYLKFALGRADAFAAGDLALAEAARLIFELPARPGPVALRALAEPWRPWRSVAARALWAYYRMAKGREGVS